MNLKNLIFSLLFLFSFLSAGNNTKKKNEVFQCNNEVISNIIFSYKTLKNILKKKKLKTFNTILEDVDVNVFDKIVIKKIIISDNELIQNLKNSLYKNVAFKLQKENLCKLYLKNKIGKCFLSKYKIKEEYFDKKKNLIGSIIISLKECNK